MSYYDRWNDRNRRANRKGEQDAERGWMTYHNYDRHSECGAAYEDGYYTKRCEVERGEEERNLEEMEHQRRIEQERYHQSLMEEEYYAHEEQQALEDEYCREQEAEFERGREILFRNFGTVKSLPHPTKSALVVDENEGKSKAG